MGNESAIRAAEQNKKGRAAEDPASALL